VKALVPVQIEFDNAGLLALDESIFGETVNEVTQYQTGVEIIEVHILQMLTIDGLPAPPFPWTQIQASYIVTFPSLETSDITFGNATFSSWRRRLQEDEPDRFGISIAVRIRTPASMAVDLATGLGEDIFAENVQGSIAAWLSEEDQGNIITVANQMATGVDILFSVQQPRLNSIESTIIANTNFAADLTAQAITNNLVGPQATMVIDVEDITIITLAPSPEPTFRPTAAPTVCADTPYYSTSKGEE